MTVEPQHGRVVVAGHSQELLPVAGFPLALLELHHKLCRERGGEAVRGLWVLVAVHREDIRQEVIPKQTGAITGSSGESQDAGGGPIKCGSAH